MVDLSGSEFGLGGKRSLLAAASMVCTESQSACTGLTSTLLNSLGYIPFTSFSASSAQSFAFSAAA